MKSSFFSRLKLFFVGVSTDHRYNHLVSILGFKPSNYELYKQALRHSSVIYTQKVDLQSNERLEFLGDAVLELVISEILFERFPNKNEGDLTKLRIKLVNRQFLNQKSVALNIPSVLQQYVGKNKDLKKEKHSIYGNALEALIGAIYLDKGFSVVKKFVEDRILEEEEQLQLILQTRIDFKSKLISWAQKKVLTVDFVEIASPEPDAFKVRISIAGVYYGTGMGKRKKDAQQEACEKTIEILQQEGTWIEDELMVS